MFLVDAAEELPLPSSMRLLRIHHDHLQLENRLWDGDPSIETLYEPGFLLKQPKDKLVINPQYLLEDEAEYIVNTIKAILKEAKK